MPPKSFTSSDNGDLLSFFKENHFKLQSYVAKRVRDASAVEDICQEIWMACFLNFEKYRLSGNPAAVLFGIAKYKLLDWHRNLHKTSNQVADMPPDDNWAIVDDPSERLTAAVDLKAAIRQLPPSQRVVLTLRYYDDLDIETIGTLMGISRSGAKVRISRALKKLRTIMWQEYSNRGTRPVHGFTSGSMTKPNASRTATRERHEPADASSLYSAAGEPDWDWL